MKSMKLAMRPEIRAIGWMTDGTPLYPIWGADPGSEEEENKGGDGSEKTGETGGETGAGAPAPTTPDPIQLQAQLDTITRRLAAADAAKGAAEKRLNEIDNKDKSELEKATKALDEATKRAEAAEAAALRARLDREILKFPGFTWHDPEAVLAMVDMEMISFDETTDKVEGVKAALDKLAKGKPYLLKGKQDAGKDGKPAGGGPAGPSGQNPTGGTTDDKNKRRDLLVGKYKLRT